MITSLTRLIKVHSYFPRFSKWIFFVLVLVMSYIYHYQNILFLSPQSLHLWRQCDCLSITLNYYQDGNNFFEPAIHNLGHDGTGKTISEFPVIYYLVAKIWQIIGHQDYIFRLIVLLIFYTGLFALFKVFESVLKDSVLSMAFTLFLFTSPMLVYYANNFLMNAPAFSIALVGLYFFFRFYKTSKNKYLYFMAIAYAFSGLLKISSLLSFAAILVLLILELFNFKFAEGRKIFQNPKSQIFPLLGVLLIQLGWYLYAHHYNSTYNSGVFLVGILPVWGLDQSRIIEVFNAVLIHIRWDYFRRETQVVFIIMLIFIWVFSRKTNKLLLYLTSLISLGFLLFIILFFQALQQHDYYTLDLLVLVPFILLTFLLLLKNNFTRIFNSLIFKIIVIAFLIHNIDFARRRIEDRYSLTGWQNHEYVENMKDYEEISNYLRSIGITEDDKVISLSDDSINISLYLMNQKGWTNYGISNDSIRIGKTINLGAEYLLIDEGDADLKKNIESYLQNKIGKFKSVEIFKLCNPKNTIISKT